MKGTGKNRELTAIRLNTLKEIRKNGNEARNQTTNQGLMKALFESEDTTRLIVSHQKKFNKLHIDMEGQQIDFSLQEAYHLEKAISVYIRDMEDVERKKLPIWKRLF